VLVNVLIKTSEWNELQQNAVMMTLENNCIQRDNVRMIQHVSLCLVLQLVRPSENNNGKTLNNN